MLKGRASSSFAMFLDAKNSVTSFVNVWPKLGGRGGLRFTYWRAHAMAADLVAMLTIHALTSPQ